MITQGELRNLIEYNPDTGLFSWVRPTGGGNYKRGWFPGSPRNGYFVIKINGKDYPAHTLAWLWIYGDWFIGLDHINRNGADNRISNLRMSSHSTNAINSKMRTSNTSGEKGVSYRGTIKKPWVAFIMQNYVLKREYFDTKEEAIRWRKLMEKKLFGEFVPKIVASDGK
jgi:hypothetical protein